MCSCDKSGCEKLLSVTICFFKHKHILTQSTLNPPSCCPTLEHKHWPSHSLSHGQPRARVRGQGSASDRTISKQAPGVNQGLLSSIACDRDHYRGQIKQATKNSKGLWVAQTQTQPLQWPKESQFTPDGHVFLHVGVINEEVGAGTRLRGDSWRETLVFILVFHGSDLLVCWYRPLWRCWSAAGVRWKISFLRLLDRLFGEMIGQEYWNDVLDNEAFLATPHWLSLKYTFWWWKFWVGWLG